MVEEAAAAAVVVEDEDEVEWKLKEPPDAEDAGPTPGLLALNRDVPYSSALAALPPAPPVAEPRPSLRRNGVSSNVYSGRLCGIAYPVDTWRNAVGWGWYMPEYDGMRSSRPRSTGCRWSFLACSDGAEKGAELQRVESSC
jgi:hypothetical protein